MDVNVKYKRWGWGAVIGLAAIILIAGLVIAFSMSSPKPNDEVASTEGGESSEVVNGDIAPSEGSAEGGSNGGGNANGGAGENNGGNNGGQGSAGEVTERPNTDHAGDVNTGSGSQSGSNSSNLPKSGPADVMASFALMGVAAYLVALNLSFKKN